MNMRDDFDGILSDWLDDKAGRGAPDYADEILARTTRTRQRPWWSSLGRWLPMQTTLRLAPVPRVAWLLLVLALLIALGVAVVAVGSRSRQVPPPFGLARNGAILYGGTEGDIHTLDPVTGATAALIAGATGDHRPTLSPDGTRLLFLRDTTTTDPVSGALEPMLMVANVDGSDVRPLTGSLASFELFGNVAWSHDGSKVAVVSSIESPGADGALRMKPELQVFTVGGSATPIVISTHLKNAINYISFRPGDREITFRGSSSGADGLFAVAADGTDFRVILPQTIGDGASLSPDGTRIAYQAWNGTFGVIHVIDVETGADSVPALDPPASETLFDDAPAWSPDGTRLLFVRYQHGAVNHLAVAPATGGHVVEIGPAMPNNSTRTLAEFSPDGTKVLAHYDADGSTWMLDPTGSTEDTKLPSGIAETASWQRTAR